MVSDTAPHFNTRRRVSLFIKMTPIALHKNDMPGQLSKHRKFQVSSFELHVCFFI